MSDLYEVFLYNAYGVPRTVLQGWEYLEFTQRVNAPWNHNMRFNLASANKVGEDLISILRDEVDADWIIRIKRTDQITGVKTLVYEGFNRTVVDQSKANGSILLNLYGSGYTSLLSRRIVIPPTGYDSSIKAGNAETVIKGFVTDQAITPVDTNRTILGLSNEADGSAGNYVIRSSRYTNLATVIADVAEEGVVDFGIVGGPTVGTFLMRVVSDWGLDKTVGNLAGRNPVVFNVYAGNMDIPIHSRNRSDEKNFVYVGGAGEGVNKLIQPYNLADINDSPYNRCEAYVEDGQAQSRDATQAAGLAYLAKNSKKEILTFNVINTESLRWLQDWSLGDTVTAKYYNRTFAQRINKITVRIGTGSGSGQREYVQPEMETLPTPWLLGITGRGELDETTILGA